MTIRLHKNARTTPIIRKEIRESGFSERVLARKYGISRETVRKWKIREEPHDLSSMPHNLRAVLSPEQEIMAVELRRTLLLPLDDLLVFVHEFINPRVSRSGLDRCLRRYGVSNLSELKESMTDEKQPGKEKKTFKDYEPGFVHVDVKYLPRMPDETQRSYLFVAIDRATRWVYFEVLPDKSAASSRSFIKRLIKKAPFNIKKVLTDNGKEFTDRFSCMGVREPSWEHEFDRICLENGIEHRLIRPRHPQTNGMVERFNGRIEEIISQTRFNSAKELKDTLNHYLRIYNNQIPQKALGYISPVQALKKWQQDKPKLFNKSVYNLTGRDNYNLDLLYKKNVAVILPSFVEGFGLPLVEAFARGKQVLASHIEVFEEIGGTAFLILNQGAGSHSHSAYANLLISTLRSRHLLTQRLLMALLAGMNPHTP